MYTQPFLNMKIPTREELLEKLKDTPSGKYGKFSIKRENINSLVTELLAIANERGFVKSDLTSSDCQALFQGKTWDTAGYKWSEERQDQLKFHPIERFPHLYSAEWPEGIPSYTWYQFTLRDNLIKFLDQLEKYLPREVNGIQGYWLDILFTDQNSSREQMELNLDIADDFYFLTKIHFACVCRKMLGRIWVIHELIIRLKSIIVKNDLMSEGRELTDAILEVGTMIKAGDATCTIFVTVDGLTDIHNDIHYGGYDRLAEAEATYPDDKMLICLRTEQSVGIGAANFAIKVLGDAAITRHADRIKVNSPDDAHSRLSLEKEIDGFRRHKTCNERDARQNQ